MNIVEALDNRHLFQAHFPGASWALWRVVLRALFALPMADADPTTKAIAQFEFELGQKGSALKSHHDPVDTTTQDQGDVARNRAMQTKLNNHDWSKHGK